MSCAVLVGGYAAMRWRCGDVSIAAGMTPGRRSPFWLRRVGLLSLRHDADVQQPSHEGTLQHNGLRECERRRREQRQHEALSGGQRGTRRGKGTTYCGEVRHHEEASDGEHAQAIHYVAHLGARDEVHVLVADLRK